MATSGKSGQLPVENWYVRRALGALHVTRTAACISDEPGSYRSILVLAVTVLDGDVLDPLDPPAQSVFEDRSTVFVSRRMNGPIASVRFWMVRIRRI